MWYVKTSAIFRNQNETWRGCIYHAIRFLRCSISSVDGAIFFSQNSLIPKISLCSCWFLVTDMLIVRTTLIEERTYILRLNDMIVTTYSYDLSMLSHDKNMLTNANSSKNGTFFGIHTSWKTDISKVFTHTCTHFAPTNV